MRSCLKGAPSMHISATRVRLIWKCGGFIKQSTYFPRKAKQGRKRERVQYDLPKGPPFIQDEYSHIPSKPHYKEHWGHLWMNEGFLGGSGGKESSCSTGDPGSIPGWGRPPGEGNGYPFQYSCLENPMDRGSWLATDYGVTKSWT